MGAETDAIVIEESEPEPEDDSWKKDKEWIFLCSNPKLRSQAREVILEYTSELLGLDPPKRIRILPQGTWVWRPDANNVLSLGPLASCRGADKKISRPFYACQVPKTMWRHKPSGLPTK